MTILIKKCGFHSQLFMLSELSLLIHSWDCLEINVPVGAVFGQSGWILSSTTEALLSRVNWSVEKEERGWYICISITQSCSITLMEVGIIY